MVTVKDETTEVEETTVDEASQRLIAGGIPEEVVKKQVPIWKERFKTIQAAYLGSGTYLYRKLTWADMKSITNTLTNLAKSGNATEATMRMTDLELQLEKAVLYPPINPQNAGGFPSGDLEALQELINEFSGYVPVAPQTEDI